ncbi:MAG: hypothetical protein U0359_37155 [Byssovorax sp.]
MMLDRAAPSKAGARGASIRRGVRRLSAAACLLACSLPAAPARAADNGPFGVVIAFGDIAALLAAAAPYWIFFDSKDPGRASMSFELGAGRRLDAFALGMDAGGMFRRGGRLGWMGRTRVDIDGDPLKDGSMALRADALGIIQIAGDPGGRASLEGLGGLTVWPRFEAFDTRKTHAYAGLGPLVALRFRSTAPRPRITGEVELGYAALFGEPPSGRIHHLELGPALSYAPWRDAPLPVAFEARARFEVGLGGEEHGLYPGLSILGGVRLGLDGPPPKKRAR